MKKTTKPVLVTGDRPTGKLHLGHLVGSLKNRVEMQNSGKYECFAFIADMQALTDNAKNPKKIRESVLEVAMDNLAVGMDPNKTTLFIQSQVPQLCELTQIYLNLVTVSRLERNPTVKSEIKEKGFERNIPAGFLIYPVSQTADTTAFGAKFIPTGEDQEPMHEQGREIVRSFNSIYGDILIESEGVFSDNKACLRLMGLDGKAKMSKSLGNCIYISDDSATVKAKIWEMYTDPTHIKVTDPGKVKGNVVFSYLDAFVKPDSFVRFLPEYKNLDELKAHYTKGGLGDVKVKQFLYQVIEDELTPIREKRKYYENHIEEVLEIYRKGSEHAREVAQATLDRVRDAIGINYFNDKDFIDYYKNKFKK
ncbi:MAG: tryptophan--tRNA ligase [Clostridia bacterium]|nr:tryptophan--tRNA ligase [Clostridia bacterium]